MKELKFKHSHEEANDFIKNNWYSLSPEQKRSYSHYANEPLSNLYRWAKDGFVPSIVMANHLYDYIEACKKENIAA